MEDYFDGTTHEAERLVREVGGWVWWGQDPRPSLHLPTTAGQTLKVPTGSWFHRGADGLYYLGRADARFDCDDLC